MDHPVLVEIDVQLGAEIVRVLEADRIELGVALWATFPEYYSPRLVFAAAWIDEFSPRMRYEKFGDAISGKFADWSFPPLSLFKMDDPFIEDLRQSLCGLVGVQGLRIGGQMFGGRYLEDGYVYRIKMLTPCAAAPRD